MAQCFSTDKGKVIKFFFSSYDISYGIRAKDDKQKIENNEGNNSQNIGTLLMCELMTAASSSTASVAT